MNILITGGAGFAGSNIAIHFKNKYQDYQITCLDNLKRRGSELNLPRLKAHQIHFVHGDIRNKEDLVELEGFDVIIDASAEPSVLAGITSPVEQVVNNNLLGTVNCLELAKRNKAKFVFLSTSRVYPIKHLENVQFIEDTTRFKWSDNQTLKGVSSKGITEDFTLQGSRSFYGATKLASELLIQEYNELAGLQTVVNRCGVLTGAWQMGKVDQGVVVLWVARHFWKGKLGYFGYGGEGKQVRDILHIQDLFHLLDWQIHHFEKVNGETFNVGGGLQTSISLQELTKVCEEVTGNKIDITKVVENRVADLRIYLTDNEKIEKLSAWKPSISVQGIIQDIFEWVKANETDLKSILN
ncbi:MAG: NAD-dependent epimerase/dehydratase family protein [Raineya sp.]|jgi:CDP-paratose 2-epimerase|nr:NAD-dependent epimerase/dehydratase family protein [Raineya sp.]